MFTRMLSTKTSITVHSLGKPEAASGALKRLATVRATRGYCTPGPKGGKAIRRAASRAIRNGLSVRRGEIGVDRSPLRRDRSQCLGDGGVCHRRGDHGLGDGGGGPARVQQR